MSFFQSVEYKIIEFQPVELRYCLGDGLLRSKTIKNSNLSRDEKVTFHFDPLPNRLCFLADCMFPGRPICIDVLDAGHQDYLGTIQIFNGHMIRHISADVFNIRVSEFQKSDDIFNSSCGFGWLWNAFCSGSFHSQIENETSKKI